MVSIFSVFLARSIESHSLRIYHASFHIFDVFAPNQYMSVYVKTRIVASSQEGREVTDDALQPKKTSGRSSVAVDFCTRSNFQPR